MWVATPAYDVGGEVVFGLLKDPILPDATDDLVTIKLDTRLTSISYKFYGTPALWWVIARVNNVIDPILGVEPNSTIRVPTKARLASEGVLGV